MDEELNRAIDRALDELSAVRPAPDFLPRLRAHVERAARLEAPIRWWIPFSASATAVVAGVIVASLFRAPPVGHSTRSVEAPAATAVPALAPNAAETPGLIVTRQIAVGAASLPRQRRLPTVAATIDPDAVLVPPGQLAAIGRLLDAINDGDDQAASAVRKLDVGTAIEIAPIQIDPVIVPVIKASKESSLW
jgi:hypothetical protein